MAKLYEYAILRHVKPTKAEEERGKKPTTTILLNPTYVLAADEHKALLIAARNIPTEYSGEQLDEIELLIRPF